MLPDGASRIDLSCRKDLFKHAQKHGPSWCEHVYGTLGLDDDEAGPLYLVTGADKCRNWCLGSYTHSSRKRKLRFTPQTIVTSCGMQLYSWEASGFADTSTFAPEDTANILRDQCVFIRGYRITPSPKLIGRILAASKKGVDVSPLPHSVTMVQQASVQYQLPSRRSGDQRKQPSSLVTAEDFLTASKVRLYLWYMAAPFMSQ
jgi:hypothetical protein